MEAMSAAVNIVVSMQSVIVPPNSSGEVCPVCQDEVDIDRIVGVPTSSTSAASSSDFNTSCSVRREVMQQ